MENELEAIARRRVRARIGFGVHAVVYVVTNAAMVVIWYLTGGGYPWFLWPLFGWGIGLAVHLLAMTRGPGSAGEERAVEREMQRLRSAHR